MDLEGKVAIVTGAWSMRGIGRACALRLARDGADVVVSDIARSEDRMGEDERAAGWKGVFDVAREIEVTGRRAKAILCDITDAAQVESLVKDTVGAMGRVDILVSAARAFMAGSESRGIVDTSEDEWDRIMAVNLRGPMSCARFVAHHLVEAGHGGSIINISSLAGKQPLATAGVYSASKAGLNMLTKVMALELASKNIRVNAVCPGIVLTNRYSAAEEQLAKGEGITHDEWRQRWAEERARGIPARRVAMPEDIANVVSFLASENGDYLTGQCLNVAGGLIMD
jgi:NAD(P)-dependent dehydrogenase (short-subunit alcohol dehydrogenase family)